ncbi:phosphatase PAP2 family protein [Candidatus Gracilibacteria bacterium]|nr:phosphatase PAP2 family protein [Candidatus Gracilibacteria bacterium]
MLQLLNLDYRLFTFFNGLAGQWAWFDALAVIAADYMIFFMVAGIAGYVFYEKNQDRGFYNVIKMMVAILISRGVLVTIVRIILVRARPFMAASVTQLLSQSPLEQSFPSAHASMMFALAGSMYCADKRWGVVYLVLATVSGLARIIVGIHFPLDILGGAVLGILSVVLVETVDRYLLRARRKG